MIHVVITALLCATGDRPSFRSPVVSARRIPLNALRFRGGAVWVKAPDEKRIQIVHSLSNFCSEHELDEEAMRAVAAGEADDYNGWGCGEVCEYDSPELDSRTDSNARQASADTDSAKEVAEEEDETPAQPQTSQMMIKLGLPFLASQVGTAAASTRPEVEGASLRWKAPSYTPFHLSRPLGSDVAAAAQAGQQGVSDVQDVVARRLRLLRPREPRGPIPSAAIDPNEG